MRHEDLEVYVDFSKFGFGAMYVFPHNDYVAIGGGEAHFQKSRSKILRNTPKSSLKRKVLTSKTLPLEMQKFISYPSGM